MGMGHYFRTLALAQEATCRGHKTLFLSDRRTYVNGLQWIFSNPLDVHQFELLVGTFRPDWVVADIPADYMPFWLTANGYPWRLCLIDGRNGQADVVIGQGLSGQQFEAPDYLIIPPELRYLATDNLPPAKCWFVWGGAADNQHLLEEFTRHIASFALLVGMKNITTLPDLPRVDHWAVASESREQFFRYATQCDRAAVQMGQTVWELLYLGLACRVFSLTKRHLETALEMDKRGWVKAYPQTGIPTNRELKLFLSRNFKPAQNPVDGRGAERIIKLLEAN